MLQNGPAEARYGNQGDINVKEHLMSRLEDEYEIECIGVDRSHWNREIGMSLYYRSFTKDRSSLLVLNCQAVIFSRTWQLMTSSKHLP